MLFILNAPINGDIAHYKKITKITTTNTLAGKWTAVIDLCSLVEDIGAY